VVKRLQRRPRLEHYKLADSKIGKVDADQFVSTLERDGYCAGLVLSPELVQNIHRYAASAYCYGDANPAYGFKYADKAQAQSLSGKVFSQATYLFLDDLQPAMDELANDPLLLLIAAKYLRAEPVVTGSRIWWTFKTDAGSYNSSVTTSFFHYDKDDYSAVRLFFYLTRVDNDQGPHVVVRGSHANKKFSQLISLGERTDADILNTYGEDNLVTIFGDAGTGFAEDPFCFHKATRPESGDRLMLEVKYATRDYKVFPEPDRGSLRLITQ
jgi:hypothetical protein